MCAPLCCLFNLVFAGCWVAPLGRDARRPEPMAAHSFSKVDQHRALLFGGRTCDERVNEVFLFNLDSRVKTEPIASTSVALVLH